ncbi:hypothetical protein CROQUDRAFT_696828 [Cronartium quercuum f. sp. fusiforme G11]|uniref:Uncharacterized protein n=1 Tax=Cronartium quercuum f. sp. fusiforme G11 TaxID=708437 RepID=A0A9P6T5M7_9BASI|nr:hypothetical protein CROQUDRAFT_696828 [Cronartium quercuum f. sp. fusiforme G11]
MEHLLKQKVNSALTDFLQSSEFKRSGSEKNDHRSLRKHLVAYKAIRGKDLISQNLSLFEGKHDILETNEKGLENFLKAKFPAYYHRKDISVAGWFVNHVIFTGFIHQIHWIYEFINKQGSMREELKTKHEFFESGLTYFVELMKQWFSEYEAILKEALQRSCWEELYSNREKFCVEFLEIAPGLIVHHLEFGNSVANLPSLSWALVFKWLCQYSAKLHNILNDHPTSPQGGLLLKRAYFKEAMHSIEGDRQSYHISLLKTKKVGDFQATTFRVPSLPYLKLY